MLESASSNLYCIVSIHIEGKRKEEKEKEESIYTYIYYTQIYRIYLPTILGSYIKKYCLQAIFTYIYPRN